MASGTCVGKDVLHTYIEYFGTTMARYAGRMFRPLKNAPFLAVINTCVGQSVFGRLHRVEAPGSQRVLVCVAYHVVRHSRVRQPYAQPPAQVGSMFCRQDVK